MIVISNSDTYSTTVHDSMPSATLSSMEDFKLHILALNSNIYHFLKYINYFILTKYKAFTKINDIRITNTF